MKNNILQKLAQTKVLLTRLESINFLNLKWSKLENQESLESLLQDDFKRELSRPLVESEFKESTTVRSDGVPKDYRICAETGRKLSMYEVHARMRMPFKWIPSCSGFKVAIEPWDWLMQLFGREVRPRGGEVLFRNWRNGRANKHLFHMFLLLAKYRDEGNMKAYWEVGWRLMKSHSYQVSAFNYVFHNWSRGRLSNGSLMTLGQVVRILEEVKGLCSQEATEIKFHRTYIPKNPDLPLGEGNARPLGVPSPAWRVYLHMLNNLIVWSRTGKEGSQHAYFPKRGVATAWREVMENLPKWDFIYEIDLKGFFDNVKLDNIEKRLIENHKYPSIEAERLTELNRSVPKLREKDLVEEKDRGVMFTPSGEVSSSQSDSNTKWFQFLLKDYNLTKENMKILQGMELTHLSMSSPIGENNQPAKVSIMKSEGVPQGAATSCSLSTIANESHARLRVLPQAIGPPIIILEVFYADDALVFSNSAYCVDHLSSEEAGITVNESKSQWIKFNGRYVVDNFKFLGLRYYVPKAFRSERLEAATRKGATLRIEMRDLFQHWLLVGRDRLLKAALLRERLQDYDYKKYFRVGELPSEGKVSRENVKELLYPAEVIKFGGSASHLNTRVPETLRDWIWQEYFTFLAYPRKLELLFKTRWTGYYLSRLYLNSWDWAAKQDFALKAEKYSWCQLRWPGYRYKNLENLIWGSSENRGESLKLSLVTQLHPGYGISMEAIMELGERMKTLGREISPLVKEISALSQEIFEEEVATRAHISRRGMAMFDSKDTSGLSSYFRCINRASKVGDWLMTEGHKLQNPMLVKLNIWNASSFACDDLLRNWPLDQPAAEISGLVKKDLCKQETISESTRNKIHSILEKWGMELKPFIKYYYETPRKKGSKKKANRSEGTKLLRKLEDLKVGKRSVKEINGPLVPIKLSLSVLTPAFFMIGGPISGWVLVLIGILQLGTWTLIKYWKWPQMPPSILDACKKWIIKVFQEKIWAPITGFTLVTIAGYFLPDPDKEEPVREICRPYIGARSRTIEEILAKESEPVWDWGTLLLVAICMSLCIAFGDT